MRPAVLLVACFALAEIHMLAQLSPAPSFEVASVKSAAATDHVISCHGGPGTPDPGLWRCNGVPIGLLIALGYGFERYQFRPNDPCCVSRFDVSASVPAKATKDQFHDMIRHLLEDRFGLRLHYEKKQMTVYDLTVAEGGLKLTKSAGSVTPEPDDPWAPPEYTIGKNGYPVFPSGHGGIAGVGGHYRWVGFYVYAQDISKTLSFYLGGPVIDATHLNDQYDVDLRWWIDLAWATERAGYPGLAKDLPDAGTSGPSLTRAVREQLGLSLHSRKGQGDIVVIDHLEKMPTKN